MVPGPPICAQLRGDTVLVTRLMSISSMVWLLFFLLQLLSLFSAVPKGLPVLLLGTPVASPPGREFLPGLGEGGPPRWEGGLRAFWRFSGPDIPWTLPKFSMGSTRSATW